MQLTTFESWQQLGDWYAGLEKDRRQPNDAIKAKAAELVQGKTTDMEKVKALYDFVSTRLSLRQPVVRTRALSAPCGVRSSGQRLRRLQGQEHAAGRAAGFAGFRINLGADWFATQARSRNSFAAAV